MTAAIAAIDHYLAHIEPAMREQQTLSDQIDLTLQRLAARGKVA
jgi:hypothetical protein